MKDISERQSKRRFSRTVVAICSINVMKHHAQSRPLPAYSCTITPKGELLLPKKVCHLLGWLPEMEVTIELTNAAMVIRPKQTFPPITAVIASMDLPVTDWKQMEHEIEQGRVA